VKNADYPLLAESSFKMSLSIRRLIFLSLISIFIVSSLDSRHLRESKDSVSFQKSKHNMIAEKNPSLHKNRKRDNLSNTTDSNVYKKEKKKHLSKLATSRIKSSDNTKEAENTEVETIELARTALIESDRSNNNLKSGSNPDQLKEEKLNFRDKKEVNVYKGHLKDNGIIKNDFSESLSEVYLIGLIFIVLIFLLFIWLTSCCGVINCLTGYITRHTSLLKLCLCKRCCNYGSMIDASTETLGSEKIR
jgi:preprotein translocase subunit SecF